MDCWEEKVSMKSKVFGIDLYLGNKVALIDYILSRSNEEYEYIVTPNVNHVVVLSKDIELRKAYEKAKFRILDSRILELVIGWFGVRPNEVIPGSTLTEELFDLANNDCKTITIIGAEGNEVEKVREKYPFSIIQHYNPPMGFINNKLEVDKCISYIINNPADIVLYAVGCPRQEILASKVKDTMKAKGVGLCIGASISFISGNIKRAPLLVQRLKLEWAYRVLQEPRRLAGRYISDFFNFTILVLKEAIK